ncbi:hypothetical protein P3X46_005319 [Hevea brasiliensis]|uniref:Subtilisin-like protease fibronectin type-III domain-containing protein n=1 Tax=Hevea brasiliensis TaxID=3981 RepID=A0ABQ9MZJ4_HEVBR|nr:hypothetical protein P3X46_005319 [Hevea brasiliensis]
MSIVIYVKTNACPFYRTTTMKEPPMTYLNKVIERYVAYIAAKLEFVEHCQTEESREISSGNGILVESTSRNTRLGITFVVATEGYKLIVTMFPSMGPQIWEDTLGNVDILVAGFGAGVVVVEPAERSFAISSGAAAVAAISSGKRPENAGKLIKVIFPSFGEKYVPTVLFQAIYEKSQNKQTR